MNVRETERCFQATAFKICPRPLHHSPGDVHIQKNPKNNSLQAGVFNPRLLTLDFSPSGHCTAGATRRRLLIKFQQRHICWKSYFLSDSGSGRTRSLESQMKASACSCSYSCGFATMLLHSMLKTRTTFTMGAPQQGGATWGAAVVPRVRSTTKREKRKTQIFPTDKFMWHLMLQFSYMTTYYSPCLPWKCQHHRPEGSQWASLHLLVHQILEKGGKGEGRGEGRSEHSSVQVMSTLSSPYCSPWQQRLGMSLRSIS